MNVIAWQKFELANHNVTVQHINHHTMDAPPYILL